MLAREAKRVDGFEIYEGYYLFGVSGGNREFNVHGDSEVVRDVEVEAGEVMNGKASGANQIQDVAQLWVGKLTCWLKLKRCSRSRDSVEDLQLMSMWMLKSPRRRTKGEMAVN